MLGTKGDAMTRYFFHLRTFNGDLIQDEDGSELGSLSAAKKYALGAMHELVGEAVRRGDQLEFEALVLADERGIQVAVVPLIAALPTAIVDLIKRPEKILPSNKLEEYRRNADDCRAKAENTANADDKNSWLRLADAWLRMLPATHSAGPEPVGWPKPAEGDSKVSH